MNGDNGFSANIETEEEKNMDTGDGIDEIRDVPEETDAPEVTETQDGAVEEAAASENADPTKEKKSNPLQTLLESAFEWLEVFGYALAVMMLLFLFVFKYVSVDGSSMSPTFNPNLIDGDYTNDEIEDRLIITNLFYTPKTGDVVVITSENHDKPLIKRVIAVGGQKVKINFGEWKVWVDDVLLDESEYLIEGKNYFPDTFMQNGSFKYNTVQFTVDEDKVFVMGDNRQNSLDSRYDAIGQLRIDDIMGKVIARVYPLNNMKWFG